MCAVVGAGQHMGRDIEGHFHSLATCASIIIIEHNDDASSTAAADHDGSDDEP